MVCVPTEGSKISALTPVPEKVPPAGIPSSVTGVFPQTTAGGVNVMGLEGQTTVIEYAWDPEQPLASATVTVKLKVPVAVGVPEIVPPAPSVRPGGKAPAVIAYEGAPNAPV